MKTRVVLSASTGGNLCKSCSHESSVLLWEEQIPRSRQKWATSIVPPSDWLKGCTQDCPKMPVSLALWKNQPKTIRNTQDDSCRLWNQPTVCTTDPDHKSNTKYPAFVVQHLQQSGHLTSLPWSTEILPNKKCLMNIWQNFVDEISQHVLCKFGLATEIWDIKHLIRIFWPWGPALKRCESERLQGAPTRLQWRHLKYSLSIGWTIEESKGKQKTYPTDFGETCFFG